LSQEHRKLAAIMFTDIEGYTALTQADESLALEVLTRHNELLRPTFLRYGGKEVKSMGDAFLVEFDSALEATKCAVEIQKVLDRYNRRAKEKLRIRVGIHVGDVLHRGGDLLGDAVNIASRIVRLADGGDICLSEQVYDQIRNKVPYSLVRLESRNLRNITFPIDVYKVQLPWSRRGGVKNHAESVISVTRIMPTRGKKIERGAMSRIILRMALKDGIVAVKLINDPSISALLARFSESIDYAKGETFHVVSAVENMTVVIDSKNLRRLTRLVPQKDLLRVYGDLSEIIISMSEEVLTKVGAIATITGELARNGVSIFEYFTSNPHAIVVLNEKDAVKSYQLLRRLASH
jgi:class 3 adenylate cyclase